MLCANGNLPRKGQVRTDPTTRVGHTHPPLFTQNTVVSSRRHEASCHRCLLGASGSADAPRGEAPPLLEHEEPTLARLLIRAAGAPQVDVLQPSAAIESVVRGVCKNSVISVG
jgi:hypothetical protein